jgi:hypothetical protein
MSAEPVQQRWAPGDQILVRYFRGGRPREVRPVTVVADDENGTVLWLAPQTPLIRSSLPDGSRIADAPLHERFTRPFVQYRGVWSGTGIVMVVPPSAPYSVWLFWDAAGTFLGWYGNLEDRHVRWPGGIDTADQHLDVWITPERVAEWRDEDEFDAATGLPGYWSARHVPEIRATGEELIARGIAGDAPFDHTWTDFTPDPSWPVPELPNDWGLPRH